MSYREANPFHAASGIFHSTLTSHFHFSWNINPHPNNVFQNKMCSFIIDTIIFIFLFPFIPELNVERIYLWRFKEEK